MIGCPDNKGSIRTYRKINNNKDSQLGHYIAGLWEGDGHIWIPKEKSEGKIYHPQVAITFGEREYPLVIKLKSILGGSIRHKKENHAYVLTLASFKDLQGFIYLVNGKQRTPKKCQLKSLIKWKNTYDKSNPNLIYINEPIDPNLVSNAWLAGFIDADGSFEIKINPDRVRFRLEQRKLFKGKSYEPIINQIVNELDQNLYTSTHNEKTYWLIETSKRIKLITLQNYLNNFPLFSSKYFNFKDWSKALNILLNQKHLTPKGKTELISIKSNKNRYRIPSLNTWEHLDNQT